MSKLNVILLLLVFISAVVLINMRDQNRGYTSYYEEERKMTADLEDEYRIMEIKREKLTNMERIKKSSQNAGFYLPSVVDKKIIKIDGLK